MQKKIVYTFFCVITFLSTTFASNDDVPLDINSLYFEALSTKDNLPNSVIRNIEQDSLGFLWLASNDGLIRYDGKNFKVFRKSPNNEESLTSNYVSEMHLDASGNPWVLYSSSLDKMDVNTGKIKHHYLQTSSTSNMGMGSTYQFSITPEKNIYITSGQYGLLALSRNDSTIQLLNKEKERFPVLASQLNAIKYHNHCLYVGKKFEGIFKISLSEDNSKILQVEQLTSANHTEVFTIYIDNNNKLWAGTSNGIINIDLKTKKSSQFGYKPEINFFLPDKEILSLYVDERNYLWIGSRENGLSIVPISEIESKGDKAKGVMYSPNNQEGSLSNRCINAIYRDRDRNLWLGTYSGGIILVSNNISKFHTIGYDPGHPQSLSHPKAWALLQSEDENVWIGSDGGGIDIWNAKQGISERIKHKKNSGGLSDNAILCSMRDSEGLLWFGTYRGGINRIDPRNGKIDIFPALPTPTPGEYCSDIRSIYQDKAGNIWIGTNWNGVCMYERTIGKFINVQELGYIDVKAITESKNGGLWIGTHSYGLVFYNPSTKKQTNYYPISGNEKSLPSNDIYCLKEDNAGKLWIGTQYGGLSCFDSKDNSFTNYNSKHGLASNTILSILEDTEGYLWLSTNVGISRFDPSTSSFINYDQTNGVLPGEFLNNSCTITKDGTFFFGGTNGVNYFNPKYIKPSKVVPRVVFTELKIFEETIYAGNEIIKRNIEFEPTIFLNYKQSVFTLSFQALQFPFAENCLYSYKLEGHDEQWNQVSTTNSATYRQIPAGTYHFKVKASNPDGKWSQETASLTIKIRPPFWKTIWAYFVYLICLLIITYFVVRFRMGQIKTLHDLHLEQEIRLKEQKIHDERLEFFTNISHEIRTPLTLIACSIEDLKTHVSKLNDKTINKPVQTVSSQASKLLELINKLLEFRRLETSTPNIQVEKIDLTNWMSEQLLNFSELANKKSITLNFTRPFHTVYLWADPNKLSMILNNLLSNAFKHTPSKGVIDVSIQEKTDEIILSISDTGTGILSENIPLIFNRYFKTDSKSTSTGIGLAITKSLVELHCGKITVESTHGKGSRFIVSFMKGNDHFASTYKDTIKTSNHNSTTLITNDSNSPILLIIEDNQDISDLLAEKFSTNYKVYIADNGESGIAIAKQIIPDIIISDIMMPGIQGTEVCQILKSNIATSHIPIILLTAKGSLNDQVYGLNLGAEDYISKPFDFSILEAKVKTIIQNRLKTQNHFNKLIANHTESYSQSIEINREQEFLKKAEDLIIQKYLQSETSVIKLAEDLNLSRSSLYRKIKMLTNLSINEFIRTIKIKKAAFLLATEDISVSEAAFRIGYNDAKYFRESFVKQIGETPSAYKKKYHTKD